MFNIWRQSLCLIFVFVLLSSAMAKAEPLDAVASDPNVMGWMQGFPPADDRIITRLSSPIKSMGCRMRSFIKECLTGFLDRSWSCDQCNGQQNCRPFRNAQQVVHCSYWPSDSEASAINFAGWSLVWQCTPPPAAHDFSMGSTYTSRPGK